MTLVVQPLKKTIIFLFVFPNLVREDTHKKSVFLVVGPIRFYPPYPIGLVVHATFSFVFLVL